MHRILSLLLVLYLPLQASGQIPAITRQRTVDSLFILLKNTNGTRKVDLLNQLAMNLAPRSFDSGIRFAREARGLSAKLNYPKGLGIATFNVGNSYFFRSDIKNALTNYLAALRMLEPYEPAREVADLLVQLGSLNQFVCNTQKVKTYYKRAISNFNAIGDTASAMYVCITLAASYWFNFRTLITLDSLSQQEIDVMMDSAIRYNNIALGYYLKPHKVYKWAPAEPWLADIYSFQGLYYWAKGDDYARLDCCIKMLEYSRAVKDTNLRNIYEGMGCMNLGYHYYCVLKDQEKGYPYIKLSDELLRKTKRFDGLSINLMNLGQIEMEEGRFRSSEAYFKQALKASETFLLNIYGVNEYDPNFWLVSVAQMRYMRSALFSFFVNLYELKGDLKNALMYQKKLEEEKSIQSRDKLTMQVIGLQADYEDEAKRQSISVLMKDNELRRLKLNQTRILFAGIGGTALVVLLIMILWIQRKRFRSEQRAVILEQKLLRSQMNPHFLFNSLTNIQNFILTEKPDKASIYLSKFAMLVRNILDNSVEEFVVLENEISTIENYLELQKIRFAGKFDYRIHIADEIDIDTLKMPPMLAQPFIENAIEHGIKHRETPGHIDIRFSLNDHILLFEVEDDGIGRQKSREIGILRDPQHKSMATSLTSERLANLNRKLNEKIWLEIFDLKNALGEATGTKVTFGIPVGK